MIKNEGVRRLAQEIWSLTVFSEGNEYGSDFELWYSQCFPYHINVAAEKILDTRCNYEGGSFIEMEGWEAKDGKPHTFFISKEHFIEYYNERQKRNALEIKE